jgi:CubicO group peptidase (beta-lactamase class C family)
MTLPQFVTSIVRAPLMEDPGTRYRYSESPTVLGRLVEVWSGKPFEVFLNERVFGPLRMSDTTFWAASDARSRLTTVYAPAPGGGLTPVELEEVPFTERPALLEGAVGLLSTAPDYLRFSQMLLNGGILDNARLLKASTVASMTANGLSESILAARGGGMGWGLANVNVVLNPAAVNYPTNRGEYGWDGSAGTIFWIDPGLEIATILMTQNSPANPDSLRQRFKALVQQAIVK